MILIIAEKPSVMKNIIDAKLESSNVKRFKGYALGTNFIYTHCIGHLLTLKMPNEIDSKYSYWSLNNLPFTFKEIPLKVSESVSEQYEIVNKLLHREDIEEVINACDSDREGDLIFRNLYKYSRPHVKKITRMWLESQTEEGIKESFDKRLEEKEYNNVYFAGKARSYADYLIGLNATRAMTCKFGSNDNLLTVGRVQTPTLRILVDNEKEILDFHPKKFYKIQANGNINELELVGNYIDEDLDQNRFDKKEEAESIVKKIGLGEALITEIETTTRNEKPKMLYSLSDLQVDMDKRYHMSANTVLNTVQSLYETHKLVTYPRTDETHISKELANRTYDILKNLSVSQNTIEEIFTNKYTINPIMIAKKDIGAHEALTPTTKRVDINYIKNLSLDEIRVYMSIVERFLAAFLPDAKISKQKILFTKNNYKFETIIEACTFLGHRKAYQYGKKENEKEKVFVNAKKGEGINISKVEVVEGETKAPSRFTEGSLIKMMKNPVKYVDSKEDKNVLKSVEGIGTEATRASIIEELKKRQLIEEFEKKYIHPTKKGIELIDTIPFEELKSVKLTAYFEKKLDEISKGSYTCDAFLDEIIDLVNRFVSSVKGIDLYALSLEKNKVCNCPICAYPITETEKAYSCSNKKCDVLIFKTALGAKKITKTQALNLFTTGSSKTKVLCVSKKGTEFEALMRYRYDFKEKYHNILTFDFNVEAESEKETEALKEAVKPICKCPICNDSIIETPYAFKCSNSECKVQISKSAFNVKKWTKKMVKELLCEGITSSRTTITTKSGKDMDVYLKYTYKSEDIYPNKIEIVFEKEKKDE